MTRTVKSDDTRAAVNTILWRYLEDLPLMVLVHNDMPPADDEWDVYAAKLHELQPIGRLQRVLVLGEGSTGPNSRQRQKMHYEKEPPVKVAVVTPSFVGRGVATALSWFFAIRAFAPTNIDDAFEYLAIPRRDWPAVRHVVATLRLQLSSSSKR